MTLDSVTPRVAGITAQSPVAGVLDELSEVLALSEQSHEAVLRPHEPGGLSYALRAALASRVSRVNEDAALTAHYEALLEADAGCTPELVSLADPAHTPPAEGDRWLAAVVGHVDLLTSSPQGSGKTQIEALQAAGVDDADIVRLTQLAGFLSYQVRFVAGLRLLSSD